MKKGKGKEKKEKGKLKKEKKSLVSRINKN
jgi:hypothetical protein